MFCAYCTLLSRKIDWVHIRSQFHIWLSRANGGCTFGRAALRDRGKSTPAPSAIVLSVFAKKSVDAASLSQSTFSMSALFGQKCIQRGQNVLGRWKKSLAFLRSHIVADFPNQEKYNTTDDPEYDGLSRTDRRQQIKGWLPFHLLGTR